MHEVFNGFFNFDAKFWRTIIPLLIKPGKVTKDYVAGKRERYTNPFRFYLTVSIIFFLIVGLVETKSDFDKLSSNNIKVIDSLKKEKKVKQLNDKEIDSIKKTTKKKLENSYIPIPKKTKKKIIDEIEKEAKENKTPKKKKAISKINVFGF
ncbi:MAG: DUF3667 domain-containing protein, partial [Polaribacter sp.]